MTHAFCLSIAPAAPVPWEPWRLLEQLGIPAFWAEHVAWPLIQLAIVLGVVLTVVAYLVYLERKVSAFMQARLGPMRVGPLGLLQPLADGLKLLAKEDIVPDNADRFLFLLAPVIATGAALGLLALVPFGAGWATVADVNIGLLLILSVSSIGVFGIVLAGWSSNSKYALLGAVRSSAQLVSYEVAVGLALIGPLLFARSLSMQTIVEAQRDTGAWFILFQPLAFGIYFVGALAETNRAPFDLPESESELVAGFHVEYSGFRWALFFTAEYTNIIITTAIAVTLFLGGWWAPGLETATGWIASLFGGTDPSTAAWSVTYTLLSVGVFSIKVLALIYAVMWIRWTLPRYRYDQLMDLGWKWMIPAALANIVATAVFYTFALEWRTPMGQGLLMKTQPVGLWLSAGGYAYFVITGLVTVGVAWLLLARINRHTSDFNLHAQRQLQIQKRADRLAEAGKGSLVMAERRSIGEILRRLLFIDLFAGLAVTMRYSLRALIEPRDGANPLQSIYTEQYPKERPRVGERFRGAPKLNNDPQTGESLCIGCNLCALVCPVDVINVGTTNREYVDGEKKKKKKVLTTFVFDTSRCMFCALCQETCPTYCIELTQEFEMAVDSRAGLVWDREMLEKGIEIVKYKK